VLVELRVEVRSSESELARRLGPVSAAAVPAPGTHAVEEECPTFAEWFNGRFWTDWVIGRKNKPSEVREKKTIFRCHLEQRFGQMALDEITVSEVARLRADLVAKPLSDKRINNTLAVLSKALKYAVECEVIAKSPRIGLFKIERPEIVAWDFEQYARLLAMAKDEGEVVRRGVLGRRSRPPHRGGQGAAATST
jgi:hypothetical protein